MTIRAQSSDGMIHEFPDGTDTAVIDRVMKSYATEKATEAISFPYDKPGTQYGDILPVARDMKTGNLSLAAPEAIRSPMRGAIEFGKSLTGHGQPIGTEKPTPDELAAEMALGGMKAAPGEQIGATLPPSKIVPEHVIKAREAGYVLPPAMTGKPGPITSLLAGWGGKIKLQQSASVKNQEVTNGLAAKSLGLPEDTTLSPKILEDVRDKAGKAYGDVEESIPFIFSDDTFKNAVHALGSKASQAAEYFPQLMDNPGINELSGELGGIQYFSPRAGLEVVKELRFNGNANLKAPGDPMKHALGLAQRQAADAIDDLMDRQIEMGDPGSKLIDKYRAARVQIAKSYDIEGAMNPATGDVNALGLGRLLVKGRPLTGELDTIAQAANAFPRALQNVSRFGGDEGHSALDFFGSAAAIAHGNPGVAGTILLRPAARGALLSEPIQNRLATQPGPRERILPSHLDILRFLTPGTVSGGDKNAD